MKIKVRLKFEGMFFCLRLSSKKKWPYWKSR